MNIELKGNQNFSSKFILCHLLNEILCELKKKSFVSCVYVYGCVRHEQSSVIYINIDCTQ